MPDTVTPAPASKTAISGGLNIRTPNRNKAADFLVLRSDLGTPYLSQMNPVLPLATEIMFDFVGQLSGRERLGDVVVGA